MKLHTFGAIGSLLPILAILGGAALAHSPYYVATTGSDTNPGTASAPFRTIQKAASIMYPGDTCIIRGGTYREQVTPARSGTAEDPITFQPAMGEVVTVSGANPVTGTWSQWSGNIYRRAVTLPVNGYSDTGFFANQVFVNGETMNEARWPNMNQQFALYAPLAGGVVNALGDFDVQVVNSGIPNLPEGWAGATIWQNEWFVSRTGTITGGQDGVLTGTMSAAWPRNGFWFYLTGKLGLLDQAREWFYDGSGTTKYLYFWSPTGAAPTNVEVKRRNFAFNLSNRSFIHVKGLDIFASTITTGPTTQGNVFDGLKMKYISHYVTLPPLPPSQGAPGTDGLFILASHTLDSGVQLRGNNHVFKNSTIDFSAGNGVLLQGTGSRVEDNTIRYTNYGSTYAAPVKLNGGGHKVLRNTLQYTGRSGIDVDWHTNGFEFKNTEIAYNDISEFGALSSDLGAIYFAANIDLSGTRIHHNSIHDPSGYNSFWNTAGIYTDVSSYNATIYNNKIWNFIYPGQPRGLLVTSRLGATERVYNNVSTAPNVFSLDSGGTFDIRNNILLADSPLAAPAGSTISNNLFSGSNPLFVNSGAGDFTLQSGSPAIDAGDVIPGITDGFLGSAPDIGAVESQ